MTNKKHCLDNSSSSNYIFIHQVALARRQRRNLWVFELSCYLPSCLSHQSCKRADYFRPEPENISPNLARTRKLIWSPNHARKNTKVKLGLKNWAMLPSYFDYIFVHLRQKARPRPDLSPKFSSTLGPNPTRKTRPDLQLCITHDKDFTLSL